MYITSIVECSNIFNMGKILPLAKANNLLFNLR